MNNTIELDTIEVWRKDFREYSMGKYLQNALMNNELKSITTNVEAVKESQLCFPDLIQTGTILAQKQSGRCWIFSALNVVRVQAMKKKELRPDFAFSPTYLYFWDKLEKSNFFLEEVISGGRDFIEGLDGRRLMMYPAGESGQWFMFANLVKKYGLVPMEIMPETVHSTNSSDMVRILGHFLRNAAMQLIHMQEDGVDQECICKRKEEILHNVYQYLCCMLGTPAKEFSYDYKDKNGQFHHIEKITPKEFARDFWGADPDDYVCIANAPGRYRPYHKTFTLKHFGNVLDGNRSLYYNLEMEEVKKLLLKQLEDGESIWFGSDCMNMMDRWKGVMHDELYNHDELFSLDYQMTKGEMLDCWESSPNHNMVIIGHKEYQDGRRYWKVENSWGCEAGQNGYYIMNEGYLERYASEFIIHKKHLSEEQLKELAQEPIVLPSNDVLGA